MIYRPQFSYPPAPAGFRDEQFHYSFDGTNTPLLNFATTIAAGLLVPNIILQLDSDAPFICRGFKLQESDISATLLMFQLKTPRGDYLQSVPVPAALYASTIIGDTGGGQLATGCGLVVPFSDEIECPPGSNWTLYLYNPITTALTPPVVELYGVKRRRIPQ